VRSGPDPGGQQLPAYERETVDSAVRQVDVLDAEIAEATG
jgi:hypothetical protein